MNGIALPKGSYLEEYRIEEELGSGTFGVTYLAIDTNLDKQVVIKEYLPNEIAIRKDSVTIVPKSKGDKENFEYGLDSFAKEAKILAKFTHPNIVKINRFFKAYNTAYFVMDYDEGQDLQEYIKEKNSLSEEEIRSIIIPILDGLKVVHSADYFHRDIKPSNIYLRENGSPMLIDFGASRMTMGAKSKSLSVILTEGYAPKEQYSSTSKQGAYTDLYAIGAIMYKMATGITPIAASTRSDVITNDEPDPFVTLQSQMDLDYSDNFKKTVDWALEFSAKKRPQSVLEFQGLLNKETPEPLPEPNIDSEVKPEPESNPMFKTIIIVAISLIVAYVSLNYYNNFQKEKKEKEIIKEKERIKKVGVKQAQEQEELEKAKREKKRLELGQMIDRGDYIKPALVHISSGSYMMGSNIGKENQKPYHKVTIYSDFEIGKYEVTIKEYKKCVSDQGCKQIKWLKNGGKYNIYTGSNKSYKKMCLEDSCPIMGINWNDAKAYSEWLSQKTNQNYRLPTEAEWEYVAKAGTSTKWSFGDNSSYLKNHAWYKQNSNNGTHKVGTKEPNPWGVYDMYGNVMELCEDWYVDNYNNTPIDGRANSLKDENFKVIRGSSWKGEDKDTFSTIRVRTYPSSRYNITGFRIIRKPVISISEL